MRNESGQVINISGVCADIFFIMQKYFNFT